MVRESVESVQYKRKRPKEDDTQSYWNEKIWRPIDFWTLDSWQHPEFCCHYSCVLLLVYAHLVWRPPLRCVKVGLSMFVYGGFRLRTDAAYLLSPDNSHHLATRRQTDRHTDTHVDRQTNGCTTSPTECFLLRHLLPPGSLQLQ